MTLTDDMADWIRNGKLMMFGEQLYRLPDIQVDLKGLKVQRAGLHIGEFKRTGLNHHTRLRWLLKSDEAKILLILILMTAEPLDSLMDSQLLLVKIRYKKCKKGWTLVCVDGYSAGWGKVKWHTGKNHYPKGLRNKI